VGDEIDGFAHMGRVPFLSKEKEPKETAAFGLIPATRAVFLNQKSCRAKLALFRFLHGKLNSAQTWRVEVVAAIFTSKTLTPSMAEKRARQHPHRLASFIFSAIQSFSGF